MRGIQNRVSPFLHLSCKLHYSIEPRKVLFAELMGHHKQRSIRNGKEQRFDSPRRFIIQIGERFVQNQHLRVAQEGARKADALLLAAGKICAVIFHHGIQCCAVGQACKADLPQHVNQRAVLHLAVQREVVAQRVTKQRGLLPNNGDPAICVPTLPDGNAVHSDAARSLRHSNAAAGSQRSFFHSRSGL